MDSATPFQPWASKDGAKSVKTEGELVDDAKHHRENVNQPKHTQTASYDKETDVGPSVVPGPSSAAGSGTVTAPAKGKDGKMDSAKIASMQQIVENTLSPDARQRVSQLLDAVEMLSGPERLLLYLRLPTGVPPHDPLKQPVNPLGSRAELQQTVTWIQTHLEVDPDVSLPKQDVYDEYIAHCMSCNMKPLSTADFGKVMKQVYPTVRPRRLGTRGNSRYCYAGLRKKIKLEVPQLPDLGESSKEPMLASRETEKIVCEWAESKIGMKFGNLAELSRHLLSPGAPRTSIDTPPPLAALPHSHGVPGEDPGSRQLLKQLKRKIQTQGTPGRPKKNKGQELTGESSPSTSYTVQLPVKQECDLPPGDPAAYYPPYAPPYDVRAPFQYAPPPPRAHPPPHPHHDYRHDPYAFDTTYQPRPLPLPRDPPHHLPINLSSDASLDLSTERTNWQRRRPPEPPPAPARLSLPGKKLILETYQSETQAGSPRAPPAEPRPLYQPSLQQPDEFPRAEYLPKKMRAAEILGGKLAAARQAAEAASSSAPPATDPAPPEVDFLEDPKNVTNRSKSTAAALAREQQEAASPTRSVEAPTPKSEPTKAPKSGARAKLGASPDRGTTPDSCCGLDGINVRSGVICKEKHSEILNRERVISICNIDKHDLDDYLNEGNSQENEEELLQYFHQRDGEPGAPNDAGTSESAPAFLETGLDPHDDHSQGKNEKISQLRELLAKNLKNQSGSNFSNATTNQEQRTSTTMARDLGNKPIVSDGAFKPVIGSNNLPEVNGTGLLNQIDMNVNQNCNSVSNGNGVLMPYANENGTNVLKNVEMHLTNGNSHNVPQSPTTRTQQYDFVPISDGCHSPRNFRSKSPLGFGHRGLSPSKAKSVVMGGSLQTSPISHSTAASPFVSPRNTPVPRSRLCPRPIPKHNGRRRRNPILGVETCPKQFAIPNDQKFAKSACVGSMKYCQPMSAPPSPNIIPAQYKQHMFHCNTSMVNGSSNLSLNLLPSAQFREHMNGEMVQPLSADPLSNEVSQFFPETLANYRPQHDATFRSQSVPLKQGINNIGLLCYNKTPVCSVPPTPVPNEFCDFGSLADTCDLSKAGLNPETLDKIYDAIDSSNDVLNLGSSQSLLNSSETLRNGCDGITEPPILGSDQLNSLIPSDGELLDRDSQFNQTFNDDTATDNVEDFIKRTNSLEFDMHDLVSEKNKFYASRSVPSTPLPYKRTAPSLQIDPRRSRELFAAENNNYPGISNGISSKSVPSTPQLPDDRCVFSYSSNKDFLINGNSVETCTSAQIHGGLVDSSQPLESPLHEMLREDILDPLTSTPDLLEDLEKIEGAPYVDL